MSVWDRPGDHTRGSDWALAYLITFTTYGTWLHGDERGSVDRDHNIPGTPYLAPKRRRVGWERRLSRQEPVRLDSAGRAVVKTAIVQVCGASRLVAARAQRADEPCARRRIRPRAPRGCPSRLQGLRHAGAAPSRVRRPGGQAMDCRR
jgi:hypothetical protein